MEKQGNLKINSDLQAFLCEIPKIEKKSKASFLKTRFTFAKYFEIKEAIKPLLVKYKFYVTHSLDKEMLLKTSLFHESSTDIILQTCIRIPAFCFEKSVEFPKNLGSVLSYFKKYNLLTLLDISTDDASEEEGEIPNHFQARYQQQRFKGDLTEKVIIDKLESFKLSEENRLGSPVEIESIQKRFFIKVCETSKTDISEVESVKDLLKSKSLQEATKSLLIKMD